MKRWMIVLAGAVIAGVMIVPLGAHAQTVNRVVSQYFRWDGTEASTTNTATKVIYSHSFFVPALSTGAPKYNVAYLSVQLVGDVLCSGSTSCVAEEGLACTLDGTANANACPNVNAKTFDSGKLPYVILNYAVSPQAVETGPLDHDMSYTWCVPIKAAGTHKFRLFLASFLLVGTSSVSFAEAGMVNIDLVQLSSTSACTTAPNL